LLFVKESSESKEQATITLPVTKKKEYASFVLQSSESKEQGTITLPVTLKKYASFVPHFQEP